MEPATLDLSSQLGVFDNISNIHVDGTHRP